MAEEGPLDGRDPERRRLKRPGDVLAILEKQIQAVQEDPELGPVEKAQTIGRLATIALKVIEVADLDGRVAALESVLKARKNG